ncbi:hypothetical protein AAEU33_17720 [Chryseobacterium sp. Chry.R1]|uniref:hypothetical protein n=1 Tax=Chryseobacterium sp. Chry.R1 TaxID=3139392 RepID=UPI0031F9DF27
MIDLKNIHFSLRIWILVFALGSCCFLKASDKTKPLKIVLNGPWKFKTGDQKAWAHPDFDDSSWETVDFTAPPGAHDGDVGLSGYVGGWSVKGYPKYSGYAWYRIRVSLKGFEDNDLALTGPPAVDDAYQLFVNGVLLGNAGDFSRPVPIAYSIQPQIFMLPETVKKKKEITIAFRVWMSPGTLEQLSDAGGIHIAPEIGDKRIVELKYKQQWGQTIKGYVVEVIEPVLFILLGILIFFWKPVKYYKWFIIGLLLLAFVRANQAFFYWFQIETAHGIDVVTTVILMPLALGAWIVAWRDWFNLRQLTWIFITAIVLTVMYMGCQFFGLSWISGPLSHHLFQQLSQYVRLLFVVLMVYIIFKGMKHQEKIKYLPAVLLISAGLFSQELSALHIQGIWFPFGVGVSRTQYVYAFFVIAMIIVMMYERKKVKP